MKLGMPALVEYSTLNQLIELCMKLKLNFIELNMNLPYNFTQYLYPDELRNMTEETGIEFTMHMPDGADLGSFYESVREGYIKLFSETIDWAEEAGVKLLNLHIMEGAKMTLPDKKVYIYDKYSDEFTNNFIKSIKVLSKKAHESNVILAIENSCNFGKKFIQHALDEALAYPNIELSWDTGHDARSSFTDKEYLMSHKNKIGHMHLHDVVGNSDHQILFEGSLDIMGLLKFAESMGIRALIEVKTEDALIKSINKLRSKKGF